MNMKINLKDWLKFEERHEERIREKPQFFSASDTEGLVDDYSLSRTKLYKPQSSGTVTIPSGTATIGVAHNLPLTPTVVVFGPKHAEVSDAIWSATSTTLTITVASNVTADRQISWIAEV